MPISAQHFHSLHHDNLLILANVADAGCARIVESLGAQAVATSSAAVAWTHGYADGDRLPTSLLSATVRSIARVIQVPLTVDIESGYSDDPKQVAELVARVIDAGGVGINIEDGTGTPEALVGKIEAIRAKAEELRVNLFINARTDVYRRPLGAPEQRLEEALRRANRYAAAGADGFFPLGLADIKDIEVICREVALPVNLIHRETLPPLDELKRLGVRRLSAGSSIAAWVAGAFGTLSRSFLEQGTLDITALKGYSYDELNALMAPVRSSL